MTDWRKASSGNDSVATKPRLWRPISRALDGFDLDPAAGNYRTTSDVETPINQIINMSDLRTDPGGDRNQRERQKDESETESDEPVAYAFEVRVGDDNEGWQKRVKFENPKNTYATYDGFEVRNVRPLYEDR